MPIRDTGFGLNYNRGFGKGSRQGVTYDSGASMGLQNTYDLMGQRMRGKQAMDLERLRQQPMNRQMDQGDERFNKLFSTLTGMGGGGVSANLGTGPPITVGPIWNQGQIQEQVNAGQARNDQGLGTNIRGLQQSMAGRGYGANSPLQQALMGQMQAANLGANTNLARETQWQAAQPNAQHLLQTQQARQGQFAAGQQNQVELAKAQAQQRSALMAALTGLLR